MGDTFFIKNIKCVYCGEDNNFEEKDMGLGYSGLAYTFEFGAEFVCKNCKKKNRIIMDFVAVKYKSQRKLK